MLTLSRNDEQGLKPLSEPVTGCWLHAVDPTPAEIAQLAALGFSADNIAYALDPDERPRVEHTGDDWLGPRRPVAGGPSSPAPGKEGSRTRASQSSPVCSTRGRSSGSSA